jgi:hypothetical protein
VGITAGSREVYQEEMPVTETSISYNNNNNNNNNRCNLRRQNVIKKEVEKILKYKDFTIEIQRMWNVKTKVILVLTEATGTISDSFENT